MFTGNLSLLLIYFRCPKFMDMVYLSNMRIYYSLVINSLVFRARQHIAHMLARYMPSPVRLPVCHTGGSVENG